jgi:hypothetical protein
MSASRPEVEGALACWCNRREGPGCPQPAWAARLSWEGGVDGGYVADRPSCPTCGSPGFPTQATIDRITGEPAVAVLPPRLALALLRDWARLYGDCWVGRDGEQFAAARRLREQLGDAGP